MDNQFYIRKAKEFFSHSRYGKFWWLEKLIDHETLMNEKPKLLFHMIVDQFEMDTKLINPKSFYSWLYQYRKKYAATISHISNKQESTAESLPPVKKENCIKTAEWMSFTPTKVEPELKEEINFSSIDFSNTKTQ